MTDSTVIYVLKHADTGEYATGINPPKWGTLQQAIMKLSYTDWDAVDRAWRRMDRYHPRAVEIRSVLCKA